MPSTYFAYGSNMSSVELLAHCPGARSLGRARVDGWRLAFTRHSNRRQGGVADIVRDPAGAVWGVLWEIGPDDLPALHRKEGFESGRDRALNVYDLVGLRTLRDGGPDAAGSPAQVDAFAYEVVEKQAAHVPPHVDYAGIILRGASEHGLPQEYLDVLRALIDSPQSA